MSSEATVAHVDAAVLRVRNYTSPNTGKRAATLCANRVYNAHGGKYRDPETALFPQAVLAKINVNSDPQTLERENFDIEVLCHAQSRGKAHEAEALADLIQQALLTWRESSTADGLTFGRGYTRSKLPDVTEGALKDITTVRVVVGCSAFPKMITEAVES